MSTNASSAVLLSLETLGLSNVSMYPAFVIGTLAYLFIMFCNLLVLLSIALSKKLQKPMFVLLFNLPISDMLGATAFFPHLMLSIMTQNRLISHPVCVFQAFLIHVYGTGNLLILTAMAYDRYIAICCPLRYNSIMSPHNLVKIIVTVWFITFSIMVTLFSMLSRFKICRTHVVDLYCNNPSLLKLYCEDTRDNNYFGVFGIVVIQGGSLLVILYTYGQILRTCIMNSQPDTRKKAIQTCGTHLVVFLILEVNTLVTLMAHRFKGVSPFLRRALGVSVIVFPPFLDPIIYGLKTAELKESIKMFLTRNMGATKL
ncbi:olfactory receptor 52B2-like [Halichoeres trimaculatus]|uniref:olfactory receptor 52B2-like n=1 Tax=Halichoeres trimaculatus TaxID=147232 RepID=UPI003D9F83BB